MGKRNQERRASARRIRLGPVRSRSYPTMGRFEAGRVGQQRLPAPPRPLLSCSLSCDRCRPGASRKKLLSRIVVQSGTIRAAASILGVPDRHVPAHRAVAPTPPKPIANLTAPTAEQKGQRR